MVSLIPKPRQVAEPTQTNPTASEACRTKSIAAKLTKAELGEIKAAVFKAGKKVSEWLRDTALATVRGLQQEQTDAILLGECETSCSTYFAQASKAPLSTKSEL